MAKLIGEDAGEKLAYEFIMVALGQVQAEETALAFGPGIIAIEEVAAAGGHPFQNAKNSSRCLARLTIINWARQMWLATDAASKRNHFCHLVARAYRASGFIKSSPFSADHFWDRLLVVLFVRLFQPLYAGEADWEDVYAVMWWIQGMLFDVSLFDIAVQKYNLEGK
jgi:hypothetical protein